MEKAKLRELTSGRDLSHPQNGEVGRAGLVGAVTVPLVRVGLPGHVVVGRRMQGLLPARVKLAHLRIIPTKEVEDVFRKAVVGGLARQEAQPLSKLLLELSIDAILSAEEDDATLGDWRECFQRTVLIGC